MKRLPPGVVLAWVMFAVAWLLPIHSSGGTLLDGVLPGFQAFDIAVGDFEEPLAQRVLPMLSALSNLLMWITGLLFLLMSDRRPPKWVAWAFAIATLLNLFWAVTADPLSDLRSGYWLWVASFGVMAAVLFREQREQREMANLTKDELV